MLTGTSPSGELTSHVKTGMLTSLIIIEILTSPGGKFTSHVIPGMLTSLIIIGMLNSKRWKAYFSNYNWNAYFYYD